MRFLLKQSNIYLCLNLFTETYRQIQAVRFIQEHYKEREDHLQITGLTALHETSSLTN